MEKQRTLALVARTTMVLLVLWPMIAPATACSSDGKGCKECISEQMKYGCPSCVPLLHCMARCLWSGTSRVNCVSNCNCNSGKPQLSDCKKCMARCKCSCLSMSS